jgi:hypothetical protein
MWPAQRPARTPRALLAALILATAPAAGQPPLGFADALLGRWDLSVEAADGAYPSWLEVRLRTEGELMGRFVGRVGSARYVSEIELAENRLTFTVPVQYESGIDELRFQGTLRDERIEGVARIENGATVPFTATRAPLLIRTAGREWQAPQPLLNGHELTGWQPRSAEHAGCWRIRGGVLAAAPPCVDLLTTATFEDFRLHAEFKYPPGGNSGVYLRGRYEVQIQDDAGEALDPLRIGAVYGFLAPSAAAALPAGVWQTLDVELVGRRVTVVLNGTTIIDSQEIPGITGGALDSAESQPGPIMLQGDHGAIEFRNVTIAAPR